MNVLCVAKHVKINMLILICSENFIATFQKYISSTPFVFWSVTQWGVGFKFLIYPQQHLIWEGRRNKVKNYLRLTQRKFQRGFANYKSFLSYGGKGGGGG